MSKQWTEAEIRARFPHATASLLAANVPAFRPVARAGGKVATMEPTPEAQAAAETECAAQWQRVMPRGREAELQREIVTWIEEHSGIVPAPRVIWQALHKAASATKGTPDLIVILPHGRVCWIEVKRPDGKGRTSDEQIEMHAALRERGHAVFVVKSLAEAIQAIRACSSPPGRCAGTRSPKPGARRPCSCSPSPSARSKSYPPTSNQYDRD